MPGGAILTVKIVLALQSWQVPTQGSGDPTECQVMTVPSG